MGIIVSKELFEEVTFQEIKYLEYMEKTKAIRVYPNKGNFEEYNIYELAHKCKEWAEIKGYILLSKSNECLIYDIQNVYDVIECLGMYEDYIDSDSEINAIIKAAEWVRKEISK